ncbi:cystathionine beta-lyase [Ranunculus cassubicifolius]
MSSTCGNCDCPDKTNCPKKGNTFGVEIIETEMSSYDNIVTGVPMTENDGKCKCAPNCTCTTCSCGH